MKYKIIFIIEILAFISISFWAAAMEGSVGGVFGVRTLFGFNADFYIFNLTIPLFLLMVFVMRPNVKMFGTLATGYFIGIVLEDFCWFVLNPFYGIQRFNSQNAFWLLHWIRLVNVEIPLFYVNYLLTAFFVWLIFVHKSEKITKAIKRFIIWLG